MARRRGGAYRNASIASGHSSHVPQTVMNKGRDMTPINNTVPQWRETITNGYIPPDNDDLTDHEGDDGKDYTKYQLAKLSIGTLNHEKEFEIKAKEFSESTRTSGRRESIEHSPTSMGSSFDDSSRVHPGIKETKRGSPNGVGHFIHPERLKRWDDRSSDDEEHTVDDDLTKRMGQISLFHNDEYTTFSTEKQSKLAFWQTLCVQFGLARLPVDPKHPLKKYEDAVCMRAYTLFTPDPSLPIVPPTLTQCNTLLHQKAHVNIAEYWAARNKRIEEIMELEDVAGEKLTNEMLALRNNQGVFAHLLYKSANKMARELSGGTIVPKREIKAAWLQPLMRTIKR